MRLFQFDSADLDFGIYRIMNYKRAQIRKFINNDLTKRIDEEVKNKSHKTENYLLGKRKAYEKEIRETIGEDAFEGGLLKEKWHDSRIGKQWVILYELTEKAMDLEALTASAYDYLYSFFDRYYEDGDFIAKRRYSNEALYAVPYNGEEVILHWANKDQYYIKTSEHFARYEFRAGKSGAIRVKFELRAADTGQDNQRGENRYFFPLPQEIDCKDNMFTLPFHYRPLGLDERKVYQAARSKAEFRQRQLGKFKTWIYRPLLRTRSLIKFGEKI